MTRERFFKTLHTCLLPLCALTFAAGILLGRAGGSMLYGWLALIPAVLAVIVMPKKLRFIGAASVMLVLGFLWGYPAFHPAMQEEGLYRVQGVMADVITVKGQQHRTVLCDVTLNGQPAGSDVYWTFYAEEMPEGLAPGRQVSFEGELYHPSSAENPEGFNFREYLLGSGISCALYGNTGLEVRPCPYFSLRAMAASVRQSLSDTMAQAMSP
ncbi:MAG: DUF4131 domain-containing protein [Clostridia bacterium]|nr:DUF4131 domain-containing protein [Clostridia bacterium]